MIAWLKAFWDRLLGPYAELQELLLSISIIGWGIILAIQDNALQDSVVFASMLKLFKEDIWTALFLFSGAVGLFAYVANIRIIRRVMALVGTFGWCLISYFILTDFHPFVTVISGPFSCFISALTYIRLTGGYKCRIQF